MQMIGNVSERALCARSICLRQGAALRRHYNRNSSRMFQTGSLMQVDLKVTDSTSSTVLRCILQAVLLLISNNNVNLMS